MTYQGKANAWIDQHFERSGYKRQPNERKHSFLLSFTFRSRGEALSGCSLLCDNLPISKQNMEQVGREEIQTVTQRSKEKNA